MMRPSRCRPAFMETMTVFDDGDTRNQECGSGHSRGMILSVSESIRTVYEQMVADLGLFSGALGGAQLLAAPPFASFSKQARNARSIHSDLRLPIRHAALPPCSTA